MAYDLRGSWDSVTGMNAALKQGPGEANTEYKNLNVVCMDGALGRGYWRQVCWLRSKGQVDVLLN